MRRRDFVTALAAGLGVGLAPEWLRASNGSSDKPLRILILGGTGFLGPHTVEYALARGHEITLFNRGRTNLGLFPDLETIIGDRDPEVDAGLTGLEGRQWDAVIDNSGYVPRMVGASAGLLSANADQDDLVRWVGACPVPPREVFVVHGEPEASDALRHRIAEELGYRVSVPAYGDRAGLR
mgnify:CR=1 FL=1